MRHVDKLDWYAKTCHWIITEHKYDKIEFVPVNVLWNYKEFHRKINTELMHDIVEEGLHDPIMMVYYQKTRSAYIGEGNHRLAIAIRLDLPLLPVRVIRSEYMPSIIKGAKVRGIDPNEFGYVKGSLYPSEIGLESYSLDEVCI